MKNLKLVAIVLLTAVTTILSSCTKSDPTTATPPAASGLSSAYVTCKVDGVDFTTIGGSTSNVNAKKYGTGAQTSIFVLGNSVLGNSVVSFDLEGTPAVGTYNLAPTTSGSNLSYDTTSPQVAYGTGNCAGSTGVIVVTAVDDIKIEGTFSFTAKQDNNCNISKSITQGAFRGIYN